MGADQQFCLRWNNFHSNITRAFESLRDDEDFVDITLACEGRQVKAHKMVLSACSPYFRSLLKGNPCQHPIVFLKDVSFANLTSILDFMYHGEVNVSHNELATFLKTAEALKVRGLAEDDKKRDSESCNESGSPGPPRDPPDFGSPRPEENNMADAHLTDSPPPHKRRRRSGTSVHSAEDTNETVLSEAREASVKNEPQDFNDEDDLMGHSVIDTSDIKTDSAVNQDGEEHSFGPSDSVSIRTQAAMQQLQESFGSFLPAMSQSSGFLSHGASEMPRPPFSLEGVQGLPPGVSLPGPSMSQGAASQDSSQGNKPSILYTPAECPICKRLFFNKYSAKRHMIQAHGENLVHTRPYASYPKFDMTLQRSLTASLHCLNPCARKAKTYSSCAGSFANFTRPRVSNSYPGVCQSNRHSGHSRGFESLNPWLGSARDLLSCMQPIGTGIANVSVSCTSPADSQLTAPFGQSLSKEPPDKTTTFPFKEENTEDQTLSDESQDQF